MGRHRLIESLLGAGLEAAMPLRDCGVDLVAYTPAGAVGGFQAFPIQLKSFSGEGFSLHRKYAAAQGLVLAYVWRLTEPEHSSIYAMTYTEAVGVAREMGYTQTESWRKERGSYSVTQVGERLRDRLSSFLVRAGGWHEILALVRLSSGRFGAEAIGTNGPAEIMVRWLERRGVPIHGADNWLTWRDEAEQSLRDRGPLADVERIRRVLTVHLRQDRTVEGHWTSMVECGEIQRLSMMLEQSLSE